MTRLNLGKIPRVAAIRAALVAIVALATLTTLWAVPHPAAGSTPAAIGARLAEAPSDGTVKGHQKVSGTEGGFTGPLDDFDLFGTSVASLGDLDGDGVTDLAVGAFSDDDGGFNRGAVWVLFMNADGTVKSEQKISHIAGAFTGPLDDSDGFGAGLANLGDLDGDLVSDLAVGAEGDDDGGPDRGAVYVLFMNANGTVKSEQKISSTAGGFPGTLAQDDFFGSTLTSLGDLDGDGVSDLAVSAVGEDDGGARRGAVWILFMNSDGTVKSHQKISDTEGGFTGTLDDIDAFGGSPASLGDLDGDGVVDLAVSADGDDDGGNGRGAMWILFMNSDGTVKSHQKISDTEGGFSGVLDDGDSFGISVANLGDLDGDLVPDLAAGAFGDDDGGASRGAVWVLFMNSDGTVKAEQKIWDTAGGFTGILDDIDLFGRSVASLGDLDGDGVSDLAVGASFDGDGGAGRGAVWILFLKADLFLTGPTPGIAGVVNTLDVAGATPGATIHYVFGTAAGSTAVPGCLGVAVSIGDPEVLGTQVADAGGNASISQTVPAGAAGKTVLLQVVEQSICRVSNLVIHTFN